MAPYNDGLGEGLGDFKALSSDLNSLYSTAAFGRNNETSIMMSIGAELVKSYGFARDPGSGEWSWSLGNIGKAFKDDPLWTTLDYLTLTAAPARFGLAAAGIAKGWKGAGAVGKAFKAGEFATDAVLQARKIETRLGKAARSFLSEDLIKATEMKLAGPGRLHGLRVPFTNRTIGVANSITTKVDADYMQLVDRHGAEIWESRAIAKSMERETLVAQAMSSQMASATAKNWQRTGASKNVRGAAMQLLARGVKPGDRQLERLFSHLGNDGSLAAQEAYKNTFEFRNAIHQAAYDTGLISKETYLTNLEKYNPAIYNEWLDANKAVGDLQRATGVRVKGRKLAGDGRAAKTGDKTVTGGAARLQRKGLADHDYTQVWDPDVTLGELARVSQVIARQRFAQGLANSVIAKTPDEIANAVRSAIANKNTMHAAVLGVTPEVAELLGRVENKLGRVHRVVEDEEIARVLGWRRIDDLYESAKVPGYIQSLPKELRQKWLDPSAAADVKRQFDFYGENKSALMDFYKSAVGFFRAGKTAYNPATHVRNVVGAGLFSYLATGDMRGMVPSLALKSIKAQDEFWRGAAERGLFGSAFDFAGQRTVAEGANITAKTAVDFLPAGKVGDAAKKGAAKLEELYRGTDETFKLDAFIRLTQRFEKQGMARKAAMDQAQLQVNKYMPNFLMQSELGAGLSSLVPFSSFFVESMRVYKNALMEAPHRVYFMNHFFSSASTVFGAMAGFSPDQLEKAREALPSHMKGKKSLILPFNVDGQPQMLDLSYMIPLGNIVEAQDSERLFFNELIDFTSNPFIGLASAYATGKDAFSGRELRPDFTERQLGIPVTGNQTRKLVGLGEYMARTFLPPWAPGGYVSTNMLELARGQRNPNTGAPLEKGMATTLLGNLMGLRAYAPDVEAQIRNVQEEERRIGEQVSQAWDRWKYARANGDAAALDRERDRIVLLKQMAGDDDPEGYFAKGAAAREYFSSLSTKKLEEILRRAEELGALSPRDEQIRAELVARYQSRGSRSRSRRSRRSARRRSPNT